jgi:hypothetical protein
VDVDVDGDVVVDGDGDGDVRHRHSFVSIATIRGSRSIACLCRTASKTFKT